ncbi:MAG: DUF429 domain-containing protein [Candidatus Hydrothermae bacterium]|nr:DUF429 domain-containing protein [Candidatus Hydrothermae bacterium]
MWQKDPGNSRSPAKNIRKTKSALRIAGIDLSGPKNLRNTSVAVLEYGHTLALLKLQKGLNDNQILELLKKLKVKVVSIDAPLSLPSEVWRPEDIYLREVLKNRGGSPRYVMAPTATFQMRSLTERGIKLKNLLEMNRIKVLETHPRASLLFLTKDADLAQNYKNKDRKKRKRARDRILELLRKHIDIGNFVLRDDHDIDALICAYVSFLASCSPEKLLQINEGFYVVAPEGTFS